MCSGSSENRSGFSWWANNECFGYRVTVYNAAIALVEKVNFFKWEQFIMECIYIYIYSWDLYRGIVVFQRGINEGNVNYELWCGLWGWMRICVVYYMEIWFSIQNDACEKKMYTMWIDVSWMKIDTYCLIFYGYSWDLDLNF